jgi:hypothetical protein
MMRSLTAAKPSLYFVPGEMYNGRAAMNVVGGKLGVTQCGEE